jgi:dipeptidyl aminopeptidase/acylaminoacyl peptidase
MSVCDEGAVKGYRPAAIARYLGGTYEEQPARYRMASPMYRLSREAPPFLFLHGDADETIPLRHSTEAHRRLLELGAESQLVVLPGVGHGFGYGTATEAQQWALAHVERFLRRCFPDR